MENQAKVALLTGGNKGLGLEVARQLGKQAVTVVLGERNPELGKQAVARLEAEGIGAHSIALELPVPKALP